MALPVPAPAPQPPPESWEWTFGDNTAGYMAVDDTAMVPPPIAAAIDAAGKRTATAKDLATIMRYESTGRIGAPTKKPNSPSTRFETRVGDLTQVAMEDSADFRDSSGDDTTMPALHADHGPPSESSPVFGSRDIYLELQRKIKWLQTRKLQGHDGLWQFHDSGAGRSMTSTESPLVQHLKNLRVAPPGAAVVGSGTKLPYHQQGVAGAETLSKRQGKRKNWLFWGRGSPPRPPGG